MTLIECRECGADVASDAKTCPKCGASYPGASAKAQRNIAIGCLAIILLIVAVFVFSPESEEVQQMRTEVTPAGATLVAHMNKFLRNGYRLEEVFVLRSKTHRRAMYVAAVGSGPTGPIVGTWLVSGAQTDPGIVRALDDGAATITVVNKERPSLGGPSDSDLEAGVVRDAAEDAAQATGNDR